MRRYAERKLGWFRLSAFIFPPSSLLSVAALILLALPAVAAAQLSPLVADGAKKEGEVVVYGAVTAQASKPIGNLFEKSYGVKFTNWRAGAGDVVNRISTEARGGKIFFDVVLGNEAVMAALEEKRLLESYEPPAARGFPKQFIHPEHRMTPWRMLPFGINFNTQRLTADQAPKNWEDLLDPKWKRKFAMANPGLNAATLQFILNLDRLLGPKWLSVVEGWARQKPHLARGLAEEIPLLSSGQAQLAISYINDKFQFAGPIDYVRMNNYLASASYIAIPRKARHPYAARLFTDFFLGPEPQQIFANLGEYVLHPEVDDRFRNEVTDEQMVTMRPTSAAEQDAWSHKFREMFK